MEIAPFVHGERQSNSSNSEQIRGAPHPGFSRDIRRIN